MCVLIGFRLFFPHQKSVFVFLHLGSSSDAGGATEQWIPSTHLVSTHQLLLLLKVTVAEPCDKFIYKWKMFEEVRRLEERPERLCLIVWGKFFRLAVHTKKKQNVTFDGDLVTQISES